MCKCVERAGTGDSAVIFGKKYSMEDLQWLLEQAYTKKNFEVSLYWDRLKVLLAFLTLAFTGYGIGSKSMSEAVFQDFSVIISCIGLVCSVVTFLLIRVESSGSGIGRCE